MKEYAKLNEYGFEPMCKIPFCFDGKVYYSESDVSEELLSRMGMKEVCRVPKPEYDDLLAHLEEFWTEDDSHIYQHYKVIEDDNSVVISRLKDELKNLDYIGTKIATGRATIEMYASEIDRMNWLAQKVNELEGE